MNNLSSEDMAEENVNYSRSESWIRHEDRQCLQDRITRLDWLSSLMPKKEYLTFPGGCIAKHLYEEARYCFVYAQFLSSITLGMAYVEHTLAALLFSTGRSNLERANISELLREAVSLNWINQEELDNIQHAKKLRNNVLHFRRPLIEGGVEYRSVERKEQPYSILEEDARYVMKVMFHLIDKEAV